jgi:hypothetical protein
LGGYALLCRYGLEGLGSIPGTERFFLLIFAIRLSVFREIDKFDLRFKEPVHVFVTSRRNSSLSQL